MSIVAVYAVFGDRIEAERIGWNMVEERLAACVNILGSVQSIYRWKNEIRTAEEVVAIFKTTDQKASVLINRIAGLHSYEVPCVVTYPIDKVLAEYRAWIEDSVR
jgi:periplasmic divalent cation tolerance protein